jgi:hypothetical protein
MHDTFSRTALTPDVPRHREIRHNELHWKLCLALAALVMLHDATSLGRFELFRELP